MMPECFDFDKEYGVVLEGGGAKGAYQIGVWKALIEYGVKIKAVAGVSVGALNGALICMGDYEKAVNIWKNISYSRIMDVDDGEMDKLMSRRFKEINIQAVRKESKKILVGRGFDVTPLRQLVEDNIEEKIIKESDIEFIMGTFNMSKLKEENISAKEAEEGYLKDYLMASASFPLFKKEKLNGKTYLDGGLTNNVPIDMLINRGYKNILVIRIYGIGMEKRIKIPEDVTITYIAPKIHLCNVLEFDKKKAVRNINIGYYDALRLLKPLSGNRYYIDSNKMEEDYLNSFLTLTKEQMEVFLSKDKSESNSVLRDFLEISCKQIASLLKLDKKWTYEDLYYGVLEYSAKKMRVKRFQLYTEEEFLGELRQRMEQTYNNTDIEEKEYADPVLELAAMLLTET